jgi:hypothetical protein
MKSSLPVATSSRTTAWTAGVCRYHQALKKDCGSHTHAAAAAAAAAQQQQEQQEQQVSMLTSSCAARDKVTYKFQRLLAGSMLRSRNSGLFGNSGLRVLGGLLPFQHS